MSGEGMLSGAPRWADNAADSGSDSFTFSEAAGSLGPRCWLLSQSCPQACGQRLCVPSAFLLEHVWAPEGQWATVRACSLLLEVGGGKGLWFSSHKGGGAEAWNVGVRSRRPSSDHDPWPSPARSAEWSTTDFQLSPGPSLYVPPP